ncbi:MAG: hypothetical protein A2015_02155 [Spirochaetes bacterium GWF1_31_7]|nr:MAG: hypothetical protein A2Y30_12020 [Spirochaetes bacterium GWE1_32_154]OHD44694.1 MAG: hypothetical protein A2Y29_05855 [Spirochaetes bacterium GWE2_31_10]OHD47065.1 MAG: hypothetical protein A2015_02155 [Spirochaetes bacterium GWF1_31_7]HBD94505.1 hypothetical protein [Spirochaetia bacterium]
MKKKIVVCLFFFLIFSYFFSCTQTDTDNQSGTSTTVEAKKRKVSIVVRNADEFKNCSFEIKVSADGTEVDSISTLEDIITGNYTFEYLSVVINCYDTSDNVIATGELKDTKNLIIIIKLVKIGTPDIPDTEPAVPLTPVISPEPGVYNRGIFAGVTINADATADAIYYTIDDSAPDSTKTLYTGAITLTQTATVKAVSFRDGVYSVVAQSLYELTDDPVVSPVQFSIEAGTYTDTSFPGVTLTSDVVGSQIYYTIDGTNPDKTKSLYSNHIIFSETTTIKAVVYKDGLYSAIVTSLYTLTQEPVVSPVQFSLAEGTYPLAGFKAVTLTSLTEKAEIRYTIDGTVPNATSLLYTTALPFTKAGIYEIKAIALKSGFVTSTVTTVKFTIEIPVLPALEKPIVTPAEGTYKINDFPGVIIQPETNVQFRYTLDGSEPRESSPLYTTKIVLKTAGVYTVKIKNFRSGYTSYATVTKVYTIINNDIPVVKTPVVSPENGTYTISQFSGFTVTSDTDVTFRYTLDGTEPIETSALYTEKLVFDVKGSYTVKVKGFKADCLASETVTGLYTIIDDEIIVTPPSISPVSGTYKTTDFPGVTITTKHTGASTYYTMDGSTPSETSTVYTAPIQLEEGTTVIRTVSYVNDSPLSDVVHETYIITKDDGEILDVYGATATGGLRNINLAWSEPADYDFQHVVVTYLTESEIVPKGTSVLTIDGLNDTTTYSFTLQTVKNGVSSQGVTISATTNTPATNYIPYIGPYLTLIAPELDQNTGTPSVLDPAGNMIVNYESQATSPFTGKVYYRTKGTQKWLNKTEDTYNLSDHLGKVHHVRLTGLTSETTYEYQIISPSQTLSKIYSFKTAGSNMNSSRFLVIGDNQDEEMKQKWGDVAAKIVSDHLNDFDFIIHAGDMAKDDTIFNGDRYYWWRVFFDKGRELLASKPVFPTMGNHDTPANPGATNHSQDYWSNAEDTATFRKYFYINPDMSIPEYYSFSYGNAYFLGINTEIPVFYGLYPEKDTTNKRSHQGNWINDTASNQAQAKTWAFAFSHVPVFNSAGGKDEVAFVRPYSQYLNGKIDWHLSGHVHTYQRSRPLTIGTNAQEFKKEYGRGAGQGVGYLIVPPAGHWPRPGLSTLMETELASYPQYKGNTEVEKGLETGFVIINIEGNDFSLKTYGLGDVDGRNAVGYGDNGQKRLIDSISYTRKSSVSSSSFSQAFYRGSSNGWKRTAMTLVDTNVWDTTVLVTPGENPKAFKFFTNHDGEKWYGDTNNDNKAHSDENGDLLFQSGAGTYRIRFNDNTRDYSVLKIE